MAAVFRFIADSAPVVAESLINSVWQGLGLVLVVWLALRSLPRVNATTRYGIWWATMLAVAALPVVNAGVFEFEMFREGAIPRVEMVDVDVTIPDVHIVTVVNVPPHVVNQNLTIQNLDRTIRRLEKRERATMESIEAPGSPVTEPTTTRAASSAYAERDLNNATLASLTPEESTPGIRERLESFAGSVSDAFPIEAPSGRGLQFMLGLICLGIAAGAFRLVVGCMRMRRIKGASVPLPSHLNDLIDDQRVALGLRRRVAVAASGHVRVPTAIGFRHPVVMIPAGLVEELTDAEIEQVMLHELAHLRRWDDWTNLVQRIIEALFFFHPAIRWAGRQICLEREIACDDWVVTQTGRVRPYAVCLTRLVALSRWSGRTAPALGFLRTKSQFTRRIEALLDRRRNARPVMSRVALAAVTIVLAAIILQVGRLPVVFAIAAPAQSPQKVTLALAPSSPRVIAIPARARVAPAFACAPVTCESAVAVGIPAAPACSPMPEVITIPEAPSAPIACNWNSGFSFNFDMPSVAQTVTPRPTLFGTEQYAERAEDGTLRVTYAQLEQLLCMGIDGDYVRKVRETAFPGVTVGELMTLKSTGVDLALLEALHNAGYRDYTVDDVATLAFHGIDAAFVSGFAQSDLKTPSLDELVQYQLQGIPPAFAAQVANYGFQSVSPQDVVNLHLMGVTGEYLIALGKAGLTQLTPGDVMRLRQYGVEPKYAAAMTGFGFNDLSAQDVIDLRTAGVSEAFLASLATQGISGLSPSQVVRLRQTGIGAEFLRGAMDYGFKNLDVSDLAALQNFGVTPEYLSSLSKIGLGDLDVDDINDLKSSGITSGYADAVLRYGFENPDVDDIIDLRNAGVSTTYLDAFAKASPNHLSPDEIIRLRTQGVSPEYARAVYAFGFDEPDVDDIVLLSMYGVSQEYLLDLSDLHLDIAPDDVIDLAQNGVSVAFVTAFAKSHPGDLDVDEMVRLRSMGIYPGSREDSGAIESPGE